MEFRKSKPISLKTHGVYNEKWLQDMLAKDPSLLGLGDLDVKDAERRQPHAGRLDLLLSDPESQGWPAALRSNQLPWCDGRCVQGPGTYSPRVPIRDY